jgi:hypothetical protein
MKPDHESPIEAGVIILAGGEGTRLVWLTREIVVAPLVRFDSNYHPVDAGGLGCICGWVSSDDR